MSLPEKTASPHPQPAKRPRLYISFTFFFAFLTRA